MPGPGRVVPAPGGVPGPRVGVWSWRVPGPRGDAWSWGASGPGGAWSQGSGPRGYLVRGVCLVPRGVPGGEPPGYCCGRYASC